MEEWVEEGLDRMLGGKEGTEAETCVSGNWCMVEAASRICGGKLDS